MSGSSVAVWRRGLLPALAVAAVSFGAIGVCIGYPCASTGLRYGLWLQRCPATDLRLEVAVNGYGLVRGGEGTVEVTPTAMWLEGEGASAWPERRSFTRGAAVELALLGADEQPVDGLAVERFRRSGGALAAKVGLPEIADGDYLLRATIETAFETTTVDLPLALYKPAIAHLMTDRPLYKPGQEVLLRSVVLEKTDLTPLDGRPGKWRILAPDGTEMHVERTKVGSFGVADTSFPLDRQAEIGTWRAIFESGDARDEVAFEVRPFKLPRFTVDVETSEAWYGVGDRVVVEGVAAYTSGAPVADAPVEVRIGQGSGRWPAPLAWEEPLSARTGRDGRFRVELGEVPADLIERSTFSVSARITEQAGEVAAGGSTLVVSKDDLMVEAVTELGDGLVDGFNNRAYLRVARPDGTPIPGASVAVSNPWDEAFAPREGVTDADAVVAVQLDPGKPVTVVEPAAPVRPRPMVPNPPQLVGATEHTTQRGLDLAERRALDAVYGDIAACGDFTVGDATVNLGVSVDRSGNVRDVLHDGTALSVCAAAATRRARFPAGEDRTWSLAWSVPDSLRPSLSHDVRVAYGSGSGVDAAIAEAAIGARRCVERGSGIDGVRVFDLHWRMSEGSGALATTVTERSGSGLSPTALSCLRGALSRLSLDDEADSDGMGVASVALSVPQPPGSYNPGPSTRTAYELKVAAQLDGAPIGDTRLVLPVGVIPPMRLRATPSIAHPGDTVTVELFRGPDFYGELPTKLWLMDGSRPLVEEDVTENRVAYAIPQDADGFLHVEFAGARVVVFVTPADPLKLALSTDQPAYRPGETAKLTVATTRGGAGSPASVGLVGVDSALGQLAPLLGPDDWGRVTVRATADRPAFGAFDPRALTLGQVRGEAAAQAAVLRISQIPMDYGGDQAVATANQKTPDTTVALTDGFYRALERLVPKVRKWEATAPAGETMQPATMVKLWDEALADLRGEGKPATDAFGRELTLGVLPQDLLEQVDPRQVVADGTRLPEDVISWTRYVAEEVAR